MTGRRNWLQLAAIGWLTLAGASLANAQAANYPDKAVTIIYSGDGNDMPTTFITAKLR